MVRIRMQRLGRRHRPFYRINAIEKRAPRNGRVIEQLGWYNPEADGTVELKADRIRHWLSMGAQPSRTVEDILARNDLLTEKARAAWESRRTRDRTRVEAVQASKAEAQRAEAERAQAEKAAAEKAEAEAEKKAAASAEAESAPAPAEAEGG